MLPGLARPEHIGINIVDRASGNGLTNRKASHVLIVGRTPSPVSQRAAAMALPAAVQALKGGSGTTLGASVARMFASAAAPQGSIKVEVMPYKTHRIDAPGNVVETNMTELHNFYALMFKMRRMEIAADMMVRPDSRTCAPSSSCQRCSGYAGRGAAVRQGSARGQTAPRAGPRGGGGGRRGCGHCTGWR